MNQIATINQTININQTNTNQNNTIKPIKQKYSIILADPPWAYNDRKLIRKDGKKPRAGMGAINHYPVMSFEDICDLPVSTITNDNAALFLWMTPPYSNRVEEVMRAWGFRYITFGFVWVKMNKNSSSKNSTQTIFTPFFGTGYYTKSNTEPCFLGIKGAMKPKTNYISQIIMEPHPRTAEGKIIHSRKPESVKTKIVELFGDLPRLEMFSRKPTPGWDVWGNEITHHTPDNPYNTNINDYLLIDELAKARQKSIKTKQYIDQCRKTIAVDFDETIHSSSYAHNPDDPFDFAEPNFDMVLQLIRLSESGYRIIIHTARLDPNWNYSEKHYSKIKSAIKAYTKKYKIPCDDIVGKPFCAAYIDDAAYRYHRQNFPAVDITNDILLKNDKGNIFNQNSNKGSVAA